jgi:hypothetical protein
VLGLGCAFVAEPDSVAETLKQRLHSFSVLGRREHGWSLGHQPILWAGAAGRESLLLSSILASKFHCLTLGRIYRGMKVCPTFSARRRNFLLSFALVSLGRVTFGSLAPGGDLKRKSPGEWRLRVIFDRDETQRLSTDPV